MRNLIRENSEIAKWLRECLALGTVIAFSATVLTWVEVARSAAGS